MRTRSFYRNRNIAIALSFSMALGLTSCDPDGTDIGDLYGRWKIESIRCDAGNIAHNDTVFLAFQGSTYQLQAGWGNHDWGPYTIVEDSIYFYPMASKTGLESLALPQAFGKSGLDKIGFHVNSLDNDNLILDRNDTIWHFSKFLE